MQNITSIFRPLYLFVSRGVRAISGFKQLFYFVFVCSSILLSSNSRGGTSSYVLTLKEAVELGKSRNPRLLESREKLNQMEANIPVTRAKLFPSLAFIVDASSNKEAVYTGSARFSGDSYNLYKTDLRLSQPLYQSGAFSAVDSNYKDWDIQKLNSEISSRDLIADVIQFYYKIILNSKIIDTLARQQKIVRESLATAQHREKIGRGQTLDVLQIKTQIALLESQIESARNQLQISVAAIESAIGENQFKDILVRDGLEAPGLDVVDSQFDKKNYRLPDLLKNELAISQNEDLRSVLMGQHKPSLNLTADYIYSNYTKTDLFEDFSKSWSVGVNLTIPLFSGLSSVYQSRTLDSQFAQLRLQRVGLINQLALNQVTSRKNLESAKENILTGEKALKLAQSSSDVAQKNYRFATIDFLQFLQVQQSLVQAESTLYNSKFSYIVALVNYSMALGQDLGLLVDQLEGANKL